MIKKVALGLSLAFFSVAFASQASAQTFKYAEQGYDGEMVVTKTGPETADVKIGTVLASGSYDMCDIEKTGCQLLDDDIIYCAVEEGGTEPLIIKLKWSSAKVLVGDHGTYCGMRGFFLGNYKAQ